MKKDSSISTSYISKKEYIFCFFVFSAFNGFHMWIYNALEQRGLMETNVQLGINILMAYVMVTAVLATLIIGIVRDKVLYTPIRKLCEAARNIARGDFSTRIVTRRKSGKKIFIDIMIDDFNTMAHELQSIETLKNDFIANVSHEIKTPLSVIQNYAAALQNETMTAEERKEYVKTILASTHQLTALVTNILKLNKLENQGIIPEVTPFDLGEQLRRCAVAFEELWERKNISFEAELEEVKVSYDQSMLEIVWNNLLSNAIKFTNSGGKIAVTLKTRDGFAVVSVTDSGIGIDQDTQKYIFDKFYQADASHAQEGNGLGLALVKKTVELVGGSITVESSPGQGSAFTICLKI